MKKMCEVLKNPDAWTRHAFARDKDDKPVAIHSPYACKWSIVGTLNLCYEDPIKNDEVRDKLYAELNERKCYDLLIVYNDRPDITHADILELVTKLNV